MVRYILVVLALASCAPPAKSPPTALDVATAAFNVTDSALTAAITLAPDGGSLEWERRVILLENAATVIRARVDVCDALADVALVASLVKCSDCSTITGIALEALSCSN